MTRGLRAKAGTAAALRDVAMRALVFLTLAAFTMQGFLTQTHIHGLTSSGVASILDTFEGGKTPSKDPTKNDEANCPLCQAFASAGSFVTPAAAAVLLPAFSVSIIDVVVHATSTSSAVTHSWRGRGPPLG
jgi:hypothetical protein